MRRVPSDKLEINDYFAWVCVSAKNALVIVVSWPDRGHASVGVAQGLSRTTMAPIPSSIDNETNALILDLQRRQKDLSEFQLSRLRDCRESIAVQQRFAGEMKEDLDFFDRQIEVRWRVVLG